MTIRKRTRAVTWLSRPELPAVGLVAVPEDDLEAVLRLLQLYPGDPDYPGLAGLAAYMAEQISKHLAAGQETN